MNEIIDNDLTNLARHEFSVFYSFDEEEITKDYDETGGDYLGLQRLNMTCLGAYQSKYKMYNIPKSFQPFYLGFLGYQYARETIDEINTLFKNVHLDIIRSYDFIVFLTERKPDRSSYEYYSSPFKETVTPISNVKDIVLYPETENVFKLTHLLLKATYSKDYTPGSVDLLNYIFGVTLRNQDPFGESFIKYHKFKSIPNMIKKFGYLGTLLKLSDGSASDSNNHSTANIPVSVPTFLMQDDIELMNNSHYTRLSQNTHFIKLDALYNDAHKKEVKNG